MHTYLYAVYYKRFIFQAGVEKSVYNSLHQAFVYIAFLLTLNIFTFSSTQQERKPTVTTGATLTN